MIRQLSPSQVAPPGDHAKPAEDSGSTPDGETPGMRISNKTDAPILIDPDGHVDVLGSDVIRKNDDKPVELVITEVRQ